MLPINSLISESFFGVSIEKSFWISDSAGFYAHGLVLLFFSAIIVVLKPVLNFLWIRLKTRFQFLNKWNISSVVTLNYLMAYFLIRYGFDKLIGGQFYFPASNTLHTELGNLSKDLLYWSTMGTSKSYIIFMALMEIFTGVFLLWNRTRFAGTLFAFGILLNVFAVNVGFDISVKYLSACLLIASILLLAHFPNQLRMMIGLRFHRDIRIKHEKTITYHILKFNVILIFAIDITSPFISQAKYPFESRTFRVTEISANSKLLSMKNLKRIHIHREGYLITENDKQHFESQVIQPTNSGFRMDKTKASINLSKNSISWLEGDSSIVIKVQEINLNKLKLAQDEHHWLVEAMLK